MQLRARLGIRVTAVRKLAREFRSDSGVQTCVAVVQAPDHVHQPLAGVDRGSEILRAVDLELRRLFVHARVVNREIEHILERPVQTRREHHERLLHQLGDEKQGVWRWFARRRQ